jgi:hypothetical protein
MKKNFKGMRSWRIDNVNVEQFVTFVKANGGRVYEILNDAMVDHNGRETVTVDFQFDDGAKALNEVLRLRKISDEEERIENLKWFARIATC